MTYVNISKGRVVVRLDVNGKTRKVRFDPKKDKEKAKRFFEKHRISEFSCSSSVDFPGEYGLPRFNGGKWLKEVAYSDTYGFTATVDHIGHGITDFTPTGKGIPFRMQIISEKGKPMKHCGKPLTGRTVEVTIKVVD